MRSYERGLDGQVRGGGTWAIRRITSGETQSLLSPIRLGVHMGRFDRLDLQTLNELFLFTQSGHLQKIVGRTLDEEERAVARADYLRKRLGTL